MTIDKVNNHMINLRGFSYIFLCALMIALPMFEFPKNLFLALFFVFSFLDFYRNRQYFNLNLWSYVVGLMLFSAFLTTLFPGMHGDEWRGLKIFSIQLIVGWLVSQLNFSPTEYIKIYFYTIFSTIITLAWGIVKFLYLHSKPDLQLNSVGHVNHSAIYLVIILGCILGALVIFWKHSGGSRRLAMVLATLFVFLGVLLTESRAAVGVAFLLSFILIFFFVEDSKFRLSGFFTLLLVGFLSVHFHIGVVEKNENDIKNHQFLGQRDKVWNISFEAGRWYPLLGIGKNNWGEIKPKDIKASFESRGQKFQPDNYLFQGHSHSLYLTTFVELGVLGFLAILSFMSFWIIYLWRSFVIIRDDSLGKLLWAGSFSAWLATFCIGLVNTTFHHEHGILACTLLGLFVSYLEIHKK